MARGTPALVVFLAPSAAVDCTRQKEVGATTVSAGISARKPTVGIESSPGAYFAEVACRPPGTNALGAQLGCHVRHGHPKVKAFRSILEVVQAAARAQCGERAGVPGA